MKAIHLIQNDPTLTPWPVEPGSKTYESGYWSLTEERAAEAVGAKIFFHEKQDSPSFFGGSITSFVIKEEEPWKGRIVFTLNCSAECKGTQSDREGWSMEMKFVY